MFDMAVKLHIVSRHAFDICEDSVEDMIEALDEERSWPICSTAWDWLCEVSV